MERDEIAEISIDESRHLIIRPKTKHFPYIYREAMEVHWDSNGLFLYSPPPRDWSYLRWFQQIMNAAREQSCQLYISDNTQWKGISDDLRGEIIQWLQNSSN